LSKNLPRRAFFQAEKTEQSGRSKRMEGRKKLFTENCE
jgi:hypothetical protein